ncbi:MAG: Calx-beta domain-containing protein, partial [Arenimonas sp.]
RMATFTVTLSAAATSVVTYTIATADGTATAPSDYTAKSLSNQSIAIGATSKTFTVSVKGDSVVEPNETFLVNVTSAVGATVADGQAIGTITNDDARVMRIARFDAGGLFDDVDDGDRAPLLTPGEYALLLQDAAQKICQRTGAATILAIDAVENRAVLADLADATNASCASKPRYAAVMAEGDARGFLVETPATSQEPGVQVLGAPSIDATAGLTALHVQGAGHARAITLLVPGELPLKQQARKAQLHALAARVHAELNNSQSQVVLIGAVTVPGLVDLTAREWSAQLTSPGRNRTLPGERVLVSPALLREFGATTLAFPAVPVMDKSAQVLQLQ